MREVLRGNDVVELSWAEAVLKAAGIPSVLLDLHTSVLEGSIGVLPRRLMVADEDHAEAQEVLRAASPEASSGAGSLP